MGKTWTASSFFLYLFISKAAPCCVLVFIYPRHKVQTTMTATNRGTRIRKQILAQILADPGAPGMRIQDICWCRRTHNTAVHLMPHVDHQGYPDFL
eukprot:1158520-Pelagomonas_calceolata.AAC.2